MASRQSFQTRQHMLSSDFEIYHYKDDRLSNVGTHHHDFFEFYFFIGGTVQFLIEGKVYDLKPGDIVLVNTSELHQLSIKDLSAPYERIVLWLNRDYVARLSTPDTHLADCFDSPLHKNIIRADVEVQQHIRTLLNQILSRRGYNGYGSELLSGALLTELLILLNIEIRDISTTPHVEARRSQLIEDLIGYINDHLDQALPIDELADRFYLSKFHLSREFRRQTGTTLHRFIRQKKLILAKELILQRLPITEVHKQCGFGDYSNFFRAFRSEYNITPRQFYEQINSKAFANSR